MKKKLSLIKTIFVLFCTMSGSVYATPISIEENFNNGALNGFSVVELGAPSIVNGGPSGSSDPYLSIEDTGSAFMRIVFSSPWTGDLTDFDNGVFSGDFIQTDQAGGGYIDSFGTLLITGAGRTIGADVILENPTAIWKSFSTVLTASLFGVSQDIWEEVLGDVTEFGLRAESWSNPSETVGFDNFKLSGQTSAVSSNGALSLFLLTIALLLIRKGYIQFKDA